MDSFSAFALGEANRGKPLMVFDWQEAARRIVEHRPKRASAGLRGDWEWTGGPIFDDGKPIPREDTYTFLASTWAEPELNMDGDVQPCWRYQSDTPGYDSGTYWPPEALEIVTP